MSHKRKFDHDDPYTQIASSSTSTSRLEQQEEVPSAMDYSNTEIGSSSSSDSSASDLKLYDVFLSFRGEDTRHSFTDHLYYALNKMGIHTFRDAEKLRIGEAIGPALLEAIEESRFAVVIFSPEYASSAWCLDELAHIIKCKEESGLKVYPVFYHVQPSEVRWQKTGKFREAFDKHEERYGGTMDRVTNWRTALSEVANLSGWDLQNRYETEVIQEIARKISKILPFMVSSASKNIVGIDVRIATLMDYLALWSTNDIRTIGIWGMGGIGKTTLAEEFFKRFRNQFDASAFVANVRLEARKGLVYLQKLLSASLLESDDNTSSVQIGNEFLRRKLKQKVLIILDDVDELKQIEALAGGRSGEFNWLGQGSRVIITTRDKQPLLTWGVQEENIYEVEKLTDDEALQLLCQKAFNSEHAPDDYKELSNKLLNYVSGLPLAIEVLGSYLSGRRESEWLEALARLHEDPEKGIFSVLQISFDGLRKTEKDIFLDIACFFRGEDQAPVRKILKSCDLYPENGIKDLVYKSLLKIEKNKLWMHDLLQQMGWHIVREESLQDPGKRSRLWLNDNTNLYERNESWLDKDACDVLTENTGTKDVQGIFLRLPEKLEICLNADPFSNMRYLRLLKICNVKFLGAPFIHLSKHLRVLEWHECPLESLPSSCQPDRLVELKMPNSRIEQLWNEKLALKMLVLIDLSYCQYLRRTLDFSTVPNLERLNFEGCKRLSEVHPTIGDLKHLVLLNMKNCESLESLVNSISLASLETFILSGCSKLKEFPEIFGRMESLTELYLDGTAIRELPISIQRLSGLILLNLKGCKYLLSLPSVICNLISLKYLYLSGCSRIDQLPEHLGSLEHLQVLDACKTAIRKVPSSILLLKEPKQLCFPGSNDLQMEFSESSGLRYSSSHLCSLMALDIPYDIFCCFSEPGSDLNENKMLISKPEIISNGNLQELDTWSTLNWSCRFRETDLTNNFHLMLSDTSPQMFFDSCQYSSLTSLLLIGCNLGEGAIPDDIGCLYSLHLLDLSENNFVSIPETISQLSKLRKLLLFRCSKLQSLPKQLPLSLKRVIARYCPMLRTTYPNTIVKWSSDEGFSFIDCRYSDKHAVDDEGYMFFHKIIEDRIHHDKSFEIRFHPIPYSSANFSNEVGSSHGDRILDWCTHWNTGSSVTLQLTGPEDKTNSTWMGLALFVALGNIGKYQVGKILCHLSIDESGLNIPLRFQDLDDESLELCCYLPRSCMLFEGQLDKASRINATFSPTTPYMQVKSCGMQPISEHDAPMFAQDLTRTAFSSYIDYRIFDRRCNGILDRAKKLESSGDVMVPAYNPLNVNRHKWKIDHDIQPRLEEELQLLRLLSGLYEGSNGRQKKFHFCFPDPVISPWFINHYAGNVALCDLPQNLIDDKRWIGLEVYVVFTWPLTSGYSDHNLSDSFLHVDISAHESSVMHSSIKIESCFGSYQLVVLHVPRMHFPEQLIHYQGISTLFTTSTPIVEIQVCGSRLVYEHDLEDLILSLTACTLRKPHSIGQVYSQAQMYVETMEEKADKNIQCNAKGGEMSTDGHSSFQRFTSIKQIEVPDIGRSSIWQKYRCHIQGKQGILESDKIIVHSKSLLLDNSIKKKLTGKESIMLSLACHHLHIVADAHFWGSYSGLRWKRCLELLLQYSEVATLSVYGQVISVMKHFSPSSPFNFCFPKNEVLPDWIRVRQLYQLLEEQLYDDKSLRGLVICATFSFDDYSAMNNPASEMTVELVCHLSDDDSRFCVNAAPMLTITKEEFQWFYFRDFMWLTYIPLVMVPEVKVISGIRANVSSNCPGLRVDSSDTCVLYRQEEEEFKQAITQCWTSFFDNMDLLRRFVQADADKGVETRHELPMLGGSMKDLDSNLMYDATHPFTEIPDWFGHPNERSGEIQLPPSLGGDENWIGVAICASYSPLQLNPQVSAYLKCVLRTEMSNLTSVHRYQMTNEEVKCVSSERKFIWLSYLPRHWFFYQLNDESALRASFSSSPGLWFEECGLRLVYRRDEEEFKQLCISLNSLPDNQKPVHGISSCIQELMRNILECKLN
ncbi:disease resistance protein Roq1-like [Rosa rugosa]|uniref:disease resistance protein Roq1-like n=1 Tax=Rosa rugosa TaxID=74645 RepID=UPI002B401E35|nr:disease resistance protein Roq1-like [Rosa rugosa]